MTGTTTTTARTVSAGARFEVLEEEAHQPFQEVPEEWSALVDAFWREVEGQPGVGRGG